MGILEIVDDADVVELDVEVLIDALEGTADLDVILELNCDLMVDESLEEAVGREGEFPLAPCPTQSGRDDHQDEGVSDAAASG